MNYQYISASGTIITCPVCGWRQVDDTLTQHYECNACGYDCSVSAWNKAVEEWGKREDAKRYMPRA